MTIPVIPLIFLAPFWYAFGCASFVYWWTQDADFKMSELPVMLIMGPCGPIAFLIGWVIHGSKNAGVLVPKQTKKPTSDT